MLVVSVGDLGLCAELGLRVLHVLVHVADLVQQPEQRHVHLHTKMHITCPFNERNYITFDCIFCSNGFLKRKGQFVYFSVTNRDIENTNRKPPPFLVSLLKQAQNLYHRH